MQLSQSIFSYLIHKILRLTSTSKHPQKRELFIAGHLTCTLIISFLYQPFLYAIEYYDAANAVWFIIASHLLVLFPLYRRGHWKALGHSFSATAFLAFLYVACTSGGINSPQIAWFLSVKVGAYWFYGRREGHIWSVITIFTLLGVFLYGFYVSPFTHTFPEKYHDVFSGIIHIGVLIYYFIVLHVYELWQQKAMAALKKSSDSRRQMFRIIVHDIKNPLSVIMGHQYILKQKHLKDTTEAVAKSLDAIDHHCENINNIISQSLDSHSLDSFSDQDFEELDMISLIHTAIKQNIEHAEHKNILIHFDGPNTLKIFSNPFALLQMISNLVSNAVKYSPRGTEVWVRLIGDLNLGFIIEVEDQGLGMTQEQIKNFISGRGKSVGNKPTGIETSSGVGAQVLQQFSNSLGVRLDVFSDGHGRGTTFRIEFPSSK